MFDQFFGGKAWFKSMTAWGILLFTLAQTAIPQMAELGLVTVDVAATLTHWLTVVSVPLGALGIRRKLPA